MHATSGVDVDAVDLTDLDALASAWRPGTRMVWVETPTNPLLRIVDLEAVAALAHERGALVVVDNTFATPALQQPLALGADVVVHSSTKYLGGHSDVVGGAVVVDDDELAERIAFLQNAAGADDDVAHELGFSAPGHFSRFFRQHLGITPSDYRRVVNLFEPPKDEAAARETVQV